MKESKARLSQDFDNIPTRLAVWYSKMAPSKWSGLSLPGQLLGLLGLQTWLQDGQ